MRLIAGIALLAALGAVGLAAQELRAAWLRELPAPPAVGALPDAAPGAPPAAAVPRAWPALFGEDRPEPPAPPPAEPQPPEPPAPPAPPLESLGYALSGLVAEGGTTWAIVSHPAGARILRVGDSLDEGYRVVAIDARGVWLEAGGERALLGFGR